MARQILTPTQLDRTGIVPPGQATPVVVDGVGFANNDGKVIVEVQNTDGASAHNVTFDIPGNQDGVLAAAGGKVINIAQSTIKWFGPFPPAVYNQADGGLYAEVDSTLLRFRSYRVG